MKELLSVKIKKLFELIGRMAEFFERKSS